MSYLEFHFCNFLSGKAFKNVYQYNILLAEVSSEHQKLRLNCKNRIRIISVITHGIIILFKLQLTKRCLKNPKSSFQSELSPRCEHCFTIPDSIQILDNDSISYNNPELMLQSQFPYGLYTM